MLLEDIETALVVFFPKNRSSLSTRVAYLFIGVSGGGRVSRDNSEQKTLVGRSRVISIQYLYTVTYTSMVNK